MRTPNRSEKAARELAGTTGDQVIQPHHTPMLLGEQEAAKRLGISPRKLWGLRRINAIPALLIDRRVLYPTSGLTAWISAECPTHPDAADELDWKGGAN